jgi:hypothetical protein
MDDRRRKCDVASHQDSQCGWAIEPSRVRLSQARISNALDQRQHICGCGYLAQDGVIYSSQQVWLLHAGKYSRAEAAALHLVHAGSHLGYEGRAIH